MPKREHHYTVSSGNVFADLGLPNPEEALAKAELAHKITVLIQDKGLTQVQSAKLLGIDQPKVSALIRGRLSGFSLERLMRFLLMLGQDIKITVQSCPRSRSQARVHFA
jgi:predicted XRE-type DNA-binding protein